MHRLPSDPRRARITCSTSRRGYYDNAVMERFFSTVKSELADRFASFSEAKMELFDYIEVFYNQRGGAALPLAAAAECSLRSL